MPEAEQKVQEARDRVASCRILLEKYRSAIQEPAP